MTKQITNELRVLIDGREIGTVTQDVNGRFHFTYDERYRLDTTAVSLSLSMPLAVADHGDKAIRPFVWGLLPESDDALASLGRHYGVNPRNPFSLIAAIGEDLQGAVQVVFLYSHA